MNLKTKTMKAIWYSMLMFVNTLFGCKEIKTKTATMENAKTSIYEIKLKTIDGKEVTLEQYKGKKILIVNTASECGYTPQYKELEELHKKYKDKLVVLGFPANDFGGQEPGTNKDIATFCERNYGVTFQLFEKIPVTGANKHPLYQWLTDKNKNGWNTEAPNWNFCKYLIDEKGELVKFFSSAVKPMSDEITGALK